MPDSVEAAGVSTSAGGDIVALSADLSRLVRGAAIFFSQSTTARAADSVGGVITVVEGIAVEGGASGMAAATARGCSLDAAGKGTWGAAPMTTARPTIETRTVATFDAVRRASPEGASSSVFSPNVPPEAACTTLDRQREHFER